MPLMKICIRRVEPENSKLHLFLLMSKFIARPILKIASSEDSFVINSQENTYTIRMVLEDISGEQVAITEVIFDHNMDINFDLLESDNPPFFESQNTTILSARNRKIEDLKQAETKKIDTTIREMLFSVLKAINELRRACKIALYKDTIGLAVVDSRIKAAQQQWGLATSSNKSLSENDSDPEFLFETFATLSMTSFINEGKTTYTITNDSGQSFVGDIKNGYSVHSFYGFVQKREEIQELLEKKWPIVDDTLLASFEFLYQENYRMALFNASSILEMVVFKFWENKQSQFEKGTLSERQQIQRYIKKIKDSPAPTQVEKLLRIVIAEFISEDVLHEGTIDRCVSAWNLRNKIAHLFLQATQNNQISLPTKEEAWYGVSNIYTLLDELLDDSAMK